MAPRKLNVESMLRFCILSLYFMLDCHKTIFLQLLLWVTAGSGTFQFLALRKKLTVRKYDFLTIFRTWDLTPFENMAFCPFLDIPSVKLLFICETQQVWQTICRLFYVTGTSLHTGVCAWTGTRVEYSYPVSRVTVPQCRREPLECVSANYQKSFWTPRWHAGVEVTDAEVCQRTASRFQGGRWVPLGRLQLGEASGKCRG